MKKEVVCYVTRGKVVYIQNLTPNNDALFVITEFNVVKMHMTSKSSNLLERVSELFEVLS